MKKRLSVLLALALLMAGCNTTAPTPSEQNPGSEQPNEGDIIIGVLAPLTGPVAVYGTSCKNGIDLAVEEINAAGGIDGRRIVLETIDEKGDVGEAVAAYDTLYTRKIVALIGDVTSKPSIAVAELAAEDRMPMITATGTAPEITTKGDNVFRTCFLDPAQGEAMAVFAKNNLEIAKVGVIYDTSDDYTSGVAEAFKTKAESVGMEVVAYEGHGSSDQDFKTQLTNIIDKGAEAIMVSDYYGKDALIAAQARELGFEGALIGPDGWDGVVSSVSEEKQQVLNNCYFTNHYSADDESEVVQKFLSGYKTKYGEDPTAFSALGYDSVYIVKAAIEAAGSTENEAIIAALKNVEVLGVTGAIRFDEQGNAVKEISVVEIIDGKYTLNTKVSG